MTALDVRPANSGAPDLTTARLLLEWDRQRPRSNQRELGMSEVGGCRRRAGYRLAGTEPTNPGGSVQAVMGTAIHDAIESVFRRMQAAGVIPTEDLVEYEVRFAGVLGHLDRYSNPTLYDSKTTSQRWLDHIKVHGADKAHIWQTHLYAAALIGQGHPVRQIVIDYIARDTGNDHQVTLDFDPQQVRDALAWLDNVRALPVEMLNRDYAPDTAFCQHCPFFGDCWGGAVPDRDARSVLYVEDPDSLRWARQLADARAAIAAAKELEAEAKGALDAIRPNELGSSDAIDVGLPDRNLQWQVSVSHPLDTPAVKAEYERAGAQPPTREQTSVRLVFVAKPQEGRAA